MQDQLDSYIKTTYKKRWEFFSEGELKCKGTGEINMNEEFMKKLIALRKKLDQHIKIISGYRHLAYNDVIGGNRNSPHLQGNAVDIACHGSKAYKIIRIASEQGFMGIGIKQHGPKEDRFIHLDMDDYVTPTMWSYK